MTTIKPYPILETVKSRVSVRTFKDQHIPQSVIEEVSHVIQTIQHLYNTQVRIEIVEDTAAVNESKRLGTYGVIKGARYYLVGIVDRSEFALEELGFELEQVVLYLTSVGLGSCWLGGTFNQKQFANQVVLSETESIVIVIPFGYPSDTRTFIDKTMRFLANSESRKPLTEIAFNSNFETPLRIYKDAGVYAPAVEALHLAPSASNKQPWRMLLQGNVISFYSEKGYPKFERVDMGIALAHFFLACQEKQIVLKHIVVADPLMKEGATYITSFEAV